MLKRLVLSASVLAGALAHADAALAQAVVVAEEDAGLDQATLRTVHSLVEIGLRAHGLAVIDDERGASRRFRIHVGRLGHGHPLTLEELSLDGSRTLASASLTATGIEEADVVILRLVEAVLARKPVGETARLATVVEAETAPFKKKPVESRWAIGAPVSPGGFSVAWMQEVQRWRVDLTLQGTGKFGESGSGAGFFGVGGAWFLSEGSAAPYVGVGAGEVWVDDREGTGVHLEVGVEMLRLHRVRLLVAADVIIPGFDPRKDNRFNDAKRVYPAIVLRVGF